MMAYSENYQSRALLASAQRRLAEADQLLKRHQPDYKEATNELVLAIRDALFAHLAAYGAEADPDDTNDALAHRVVRNDSVTKTAVLRALALVESTPAIQSASRQSVQNREDVETGWYSARNLIDAVAPMVRG